MESRKFSPRLAMSTPVYTMTLSICTWHWNLPIAALPAIGFRHAWHQLQKMKINIELESTLLPFPDKEMRHRPQLKSNSRCIAFQIASYLKKNVRTRITWISRLRFLSRVIGRKEEVNFEQWLLIHKRSSRTYAEVRYHYPYPLFP